ncbi:MAG: LacI family DNA-binding transcriptional regulator [Candidatus Nanopelagicales bacterium]
MATKRPTLAKVAALAGVSVSQASDALRDGGRVSAATRERVRAAARQLGYQTQSVAKVLREGMTDFIAVVADRETTNAPDGSIYPFWSKFLTAFTITVREYGYAVIFDFDGSTKEVNRLPAQAVLVLTSDASRVDSLKGGGFGQVVALSPDADPVEVVGPDANAVILQHDYQELGRASAEHLLAAGCHHLMVLRRPGTHWYASRIEDGLRDAADEVGVDLAVAELDLTGPDLLASVREVLTTNPAIDGIFDFTGMTPGLAEVLAESGRSPAAQAGADTVAMMVQSEGTGPQTDSRVSYLSFLGTECGEIIAEHFVARLYGRKLPSPELPYRIIPAH